MSVRLIGTVIAHAHTTEPQGLALLLVLANHARDVDNTAWPAVGTLAREARMSPSTTRRWLHRLEAAGDIRIRQSRGGRTSRYVVTVNPSDSDRVPMVPNPSDSDRVWVAPNPSIPGNNPSDSDRVTLPTVTGKTLENPYETSKKRADARVNESENKDMIEPNHDRANAITDLETALQALDAFHDEHTNRTLVGKRAQSAYGLGTEFPFVYRNASVDELEALTAYAHDLIEQMEAEEALVAEALRPR